MQALKIENAPLVASTLAVDNVATVLFLSAMFLIPASTPKTLLASSQNPENDSHAEPPSPTFLYPPYGIILGMAYFVC